MDSVEEQGRVLVSRTMATCSLLLTKHIEINDLNTTITLLQQQKAALQGFSIVLSGLLAEKWTAERNINNHLGHEAAAEAHRKASMEYQSKVETSKNNTSDNDIEQLYCIMSQLHATLDIKHTERSQYHNNSPSTITSITGEQWIQHID